MRWWAGRACSCTVLLLNAYVTALQMWALRRMLPHPPPKAAGIAEQRRAPLRELVCSSQKFLAFLARNVRKHRGKGRSVDKGWHALGHAAEACQRCLPRQHASITTCPVYLTDVLAAGA